MLETYQFGSDIMLFKLSDTLKTYNDNKMPYSIFVKKHSFYDYRHAEVTDYGYNMIFQGVHHVVKSPVLNDFDLSLSVKHGTPFFYGANIVWGVSFAYNDDSDTYYDLLITHELDKNTSVALRKVQKRKNQVLEQKIIPYILTDKGYDLALSYKNGILDVTIDNEVLQFKTPQNLSGKIAFFKEDGYKEIYLSNLSLVGDFDGEVKNVFPEKTFVLPCHNGEEQPYKIKVKIDEITSGLHMVSCEFFGGANGDRKDCEKIAPIMLLRDFITKPYVKINNGEKLYISNQKMMFCDVCYENISDREEIMNTFKYFNYLPELPLKVNFLTQIENTKDINVHYGAENIYTVYSGAFAGEREVVFTSNGTPLYSGKNLDGKYTLQTQSQLNERLFSNIPKDIPDRELIREHLKGNHYFYNDENPKFLINLFTNEGIEDVSVKATLQNAFMQDVCPVNVKFDCENGLLTGLKTYSYNVELKKLKVGVYHLNLSVYKNLIEVENHVSAFEVLDVEGKMCPQQASGLPLSYTRDGGGYNLFTASPDFWNTTPDFNNVHYYSICQVPPATAEKRRMWEVLKIFGRKLFIWATTRCVYPQVLHSKEFINSEAVKHADYINLYYPGIENSGIDYRCDYVEEKTYKDSKLVEFFEEFLTLNPKFSKQLGYDKFPQNFCDKDRVELFKFLDVCKVEWIDFANAKMAELFKAQWEEVKKVNPNAKRSSYGPFPIYGGSSLSAHSVKWYGVDPKKTDELFDGFYQFEDYPYCCSYSTTACAWSVATIKALSPKTVICPEIYGPLGLGCLDGFVACARPPFGKYDHPDYVNATQMAEYFYNTARLTQNGFEYWNDDAFVFYEYYTVDNNTRMRKIIKDYGVFKNNLPKSPMKGIAYLYEIPDSDDRYDHDIHYRCFHNNSESGLGYVNFVAREMGYDGFLVDNNSVLKLDKNKVSLLVLPSMDNASDQVIEKIRSLYADGVKLLLTGKAGKLSDIFGVRENSKISYVKKLTYRNEVEGITQVDGEFINENIDANVLVKGDNGLPVTLVKGGAYTLNIGVGKAGVDNFIKFVIPFSGRRNISALLRKSVEEFLSKNVKPLVKTENGVGVTLFKNKKGEKLMLLIDYSNHETENIGKARTISLAFDNIKVKDIKVLSEYSGLLDKYRKNGRLVSARLDIKTHQAILIKIK